MMIDGTPQSGVTYELATFGSRAVALIIDQIILFGISIIIGTLTPNTSDTVALIIGFAINFLFHYYFWTQRDGQTPGKLYLDIKIIKSDGSPINSTDTLVRVIGYMFGGLSLGIGYLWALFDPNSQAWHDKMARTYVVKANKRKREVTL